MSSIVRRGDVRVFHPKQRRTRFSLFGLASPAEILVLDGIAIAVYEDDRSVQYATLDELLDDHRLTHDDLHAV